MATTADFIEYVCERLSPLCPVRYRKMFGEYAVYSGEKFILLVCDNCVFVKKLPELADIMENAPCGDPYEGAGEHYILDIENNELLERLVPVLVEFSAPPKKRRRKKLD